MDNTEGSQVITQIYKARKNLVLHLSIRQMSILLGSILGDSYVYPKGKVCFEQGEKQKEYLLWKYSELKSLAYPKVSQVIRLDKRRNIRTISWRFFLRQYFRPLRNAFYEHNKKRIPNSLMKWFSPILLAVWYMDDGYLDRRNPLLMTDSFSFDDIQRLVIILKRKFQLECLITNKHRIRIRHSSSSKFFHLVEPFIHKELRYKLP